MSLFSPTQNHIDQAAEILKKGGLVAFPTETVYGLGADAFQAAACRKIYEVKGRPGFNPLIVHCLDIEDVMSLGILNASAQRLAAAFWPGPLTLILKKQPFSDLPLVVTASLETVALRIPSHSIARALLKALGRPIAAPSANHSGFLSPTLARHVYADLNQKVDIILENEDIEVGLESTILDLSEERPLLLRSGGLEIEKVEALLGQNVDIPSKEAPLKSPGQLLRHYAPHHSLRLNITEIKETEALLAFGEPLGGARFSLNLSLQRDLKEAARNLFSFLHILDARSDITGIGVQAIPEIGLGRAINDRLRRAAEGSNRS